MDGNSNDWRYVSVRRTITYIEQSIKTGLNSLIFSPNDANTWATATSMVEDFLFSLWNKSGLQGVPPEPAFFVLCGLGSTMTVDDILNSRINLSVTVVVVSSVDFITLTFRQQLATSQ